MVDPSESYHAAHNESLQTALGETLDPVPESLNSRTGSTTASTAEHNFADGDEDSIQGSQPDMFSTVSHQHLRRLSPSTSSTTTPKLITNLTGSEADRCRERVIDEVSSWDGCSLNKESIRKRLIFKVDGNGIPHNRPPRGDIDEERKRLEYYSVTRKTEVTGEIKSRASSSTSPTPPAQHHRNSVNGDGDPETENTREEAVGKGKVMLMLSTMLEINESYYLKRGFVTTAVRRF